MTNASTTPRPAPQLLGLAVASLVISCLSVLLGPCGCLPALLGIVCGHSARRQIRKDPEFCGAGVALAGLIVGYVVLAASAILVLYVFLPIVAECIAARWL
jgi:hypothetical protein